MVAEELLVDHPPLPVPRRILGHREDDADVLGLAFEFLQLVEECRRLAIPVGVQQRHAVRQLLLGDVAQHAAEDRDADTAGNEHIGAVGLLG